MKKPTSRTKSRGDDWRSRGRGADYEPFLTVRDVPSKGRSSRLGPGWKTGRVHHVLSGLEESYFYTLEWSMQVIDIREQFELPLEATVAIAQELGLAQGTSLTVVRHLLATRRWSTDMQIAIEPTEPVVLISHTTTSKEAYGTIHQLANRVAWRSRFIRIRSWAKSSCRR